jgi:hypothetical protein
MHRYQRPVNKFDKLHCCTILTKNILFLPTERQCALYLHPNFRLKLKLHNLGCKNALQPIYKHLKIAMSSHLHQFKFNLLAELVQ